MMRPLTALALLGALLATACDEAAQSPDARLDNAEDPSEGVEPTEADPGNADAPEPGASRRPVTEDERALLAAMYGEGFADSIDDVGLMSLSLTVDGETTVETFAGVVSQSDELPLSGGDQLLWTGLTAWSEMDPDTGTVEQMLIVEGPDIVEPGTVELVDTQVELGPWASFADGPNLWSYVSIGGEFEIDAVEFVEDVVCPFDVSGVDCTQSTGSIQGSLEMSTIGFPALIYAEGEGIPPLEIGTTPSGSFRADFVFEYDLPVVRYTARPL